MQLGDRPNSSQLKSFSINGLFGYKDVKIPFDKEALILIAENGSGKTTILNTLYYAISCQFHKLNNVEFESIVLEFMSGEIAEIKKSDLRLLSSNDFLIEALLSASKEKTDIFKKESIARKFLNSREVLNLISNEGATLVVDNESNIISTIIRNLKESILHFPTYRRIEEELQNLGYEDDNFPELNFLEDRLIQFGMNDVIDKLKEVQNSAEIDDSLNQFAQTCNKYLHKKKIIYDEASVDISIIETRNNTPIDLGNLSSGEKQIISIFSKIYLEPSKDFIVLFDEPELSLSIEWQRRLLPDILKSNKCKLLLAVTHSPFIFDNELDPNAHDLHILVQER